MLEALMKIVFFPKYPGRAGNGPDMMPKGYSCLHLIWAEICFLAG